MLNLFLLFRSRWCSFAENPQEDFALSDTKLTPNLPFQRWLDAATPLMKRYLEVWADTKECMFRQWASGRRNLSAEMAGAIESATVEIAKTVPGAPPALTRGDLCSACAKCSYFQDAQKDVDDHK